MDNGAAISAQSADRPRSITVDGEVRTYAGGRRRAVTSTGVEEVFEFRLLGVTLTTIETLKTWIGANVQVRDHRGQRYVGVLFNFGVMEKREPTKYDVTTSLSVVSFVEGV